MTLADLQPDVALKALLDGKVKAKSASGEMVTLRVFADGEHGNKDADDEYIEILYNGNPQNVTQGSTAMRGYMALYLRCKLQTDTKVKTSRMRLIQNQIEPLIKAAVSQGYTFSLQPQPITPTQRDYTTGYAYTTYNLEWKYGINN